MFQLKAGDGSCSNVANPQNRESRLSLKQESNLFFSVAHGVDDETDKNCLDMTGVELGVMSGDAVGLAVRNFSSVAKLDEKNIQSSRECHATKQINADEAEFSALAEFSASEKMASQARW
jgi:hypothetical protein